MSRLSGTDPHPLLRHVRERCATLRLPCFVYDPAALADAIARVRAAFPHVLYPVKCNPETALVRAAAQSGAGLDLCSAGDVDIAVRAGVDLARCTYTGALPFDRACVELLVASGCQVDLGTIDEIRAWTDLAPGRPCGVRLRVAGSRTGYAIKFGMTASELLEARALLKRRGAALSGIHLHDSHQGRSPAEAARLLASALSEVPAEAVREISSINLGGGWPYHYAAAIPATHARVNAHDDANAAWTAEDVAAAFAREIRPVLDRGGFAGRMMVEPGEFLVSAAGVWLAEVVSVKSHPVEPGRRVIVLDTPTPVPCADLGYPISVLRQGPEGRASGAGPCAIYGSSNSARDLIRNDAALPEVRRGDILAIAETGAYVRSLISTFNERQLPPAYVAPLSA